MWMCFLFFFGGGGSDVTTYDGLDAVIHVRLDAALFVFDATDELSQLILFDDERHLLLVIYRGVFGGRHVCWVGDRTSKKKKSKL